MVNITNNKCRCACVICKTVVTEIITVMIKILISASSKTIYCDSTTHSAYIGAIKCGYFKKSAEYNTLGWKNTVGTRQLALYYYH